MGDRLILRPELIQHLHGPLQVELNVVAGGQKPGHGLRKAFRKLRGYISHDKFNCKYKLRTD